MTVLAILTTSQLGECVVGGMLLFWIAFTIYVARQPAPFDSKERRALDELRRISKK